MPDIKPYWVWRVYHKQGIYRAEYAVNRWWGRWHTLTDGWGAYHDYSNAEEAKKGVLYILQNKERERQFRLSQWEVVETGVYPE